MKRYVNWRSGTPAVCANSFTGGGGMNVVL